MIILGIFAGVAAVAILCCLLVRLAVHALPVFIGFGFAGLAHHAGTSPLGTLLVGIIAASVTLALGQAIVGRSASGARRALTLSAFVASAIVAGFAATHGILVHALYSPAWQVLFSIIGGIAIGKAAFNRLTESAATGWHHQRR